MIILSKSYCDSHGQTRTCSHPTNKFICPLENNWRYRLGKSLWVEGRHLAAVHMWVMILSISAEGGRASGMDSWDEAWGGAFQPESLSGDQKEVGHPVAGPGVLGSA